MVSVIVVTYNSERSIEKCLESVFAQRADVPLEVIVVDNASQDKTCDVVQLKFADVTLLKNDGNKGFAAACNQAILKSRGEFILLLNPDAVLEPECLTKLISFMKQNEKCAASGPSLRAADGAFQPSAFNFPNFPWLFFHLLRLSEWVPGKAILRVLVESSSKQPSGDKPSSVDWVIGACMMMRREAVDDVGIFDENFFLFFEEIDWCKRALKKGWQVFYVSNACAVHEVGGSSKSARVLSIVSRYKSMAYYFKKHYGMTGYLYVRVLLFLFFLSRLFFLKLFHSRQTEAREKIKAYKQVLFHE